MKRGLRLTILLSCVLPGVFFSGCSLDMFGSKSDDAVTKRKNYRQTNPGCSQFSIPETGLDAKSFRALVQCFNSNGSIPEFQALTEKANDRTISALTHILNGSFFRNEAQIGETFVFFSHLDKIAHLDQSVASITQLFKNPDSIAALLQFIDTAREGSLSPNARELKLLSKWVESVTPEGFELYLGAFEKAVRTDDFGSIVTAFQKNPLNSDERKTIREAIQAWVSDKPGSRLASSNTGSAVLGRKLFQGSGRNLFQLLLEDTKLSSRWIDSVFIPGPNRSPWIDSFEGLKHGLSAPIQCMGGSLRYKDPWSELISELKLNSGDDFYDFSVRRGSTQTLILRECCKIPDSVLVSYENLLRGFSGDDGVLFARALEAGVQGGLGDAFGKWLDRDSEILSPIFRIFFKRGISESVLKILSALSDDEWSKIGKTLDEFSEAGYPAAAKSWLARLSDEELDRLGSLILALPGLAAHESVEPFGEALSEIRGLFRASNRHSWWEGIRVILKDCIEGKNEFATLGELSRLPEFKPALRMLYEMGQDRRLSAMLFDLVRLFASTVREFPSETMIAEKWPDESKKHFTLKSAKAYPKPKYARACSQLKLGQTIESQKRNFYDCIGGSASSESLEAWVSRLEKRQASAGGTLANSVFSRVIALMKTEFKTESKAKWIGDLMRKKKLPEFFDSILDVQLFSKERFSKELQNVFQRFVSAPETLDRFFERFSQYVRAPAFMEVNRWFDASRGSGIAMPKSKFHARTDEASTRKMLTERECVETAGDVQTRLNELENDIENSVVGWESVGGRSRQNWSENEFLERLKNLQPFLNDPVVSEGVRKMLTELNVRHGASSVLSWFEARSQDVKPVMYIFPGEKEARVRWMSTLDRLEVLLTAADFKFATWMYEDNFALKFITQIGDSWGDEPRESWPLEIQKKFPGNKRPQTLSETYEDIMGFLKKFSNLGGLPIVGKCASAREYDPVMSAPGLLVPFWVKANLFNLKQVLPVYAENLPNAEGEMRDGMRFLRDLFYFVGTAGLEKNRDPSRPDTHPLSIIRALGRLGFLRSASLYFSERDAGLRSRDAEMFGLVLKMASVPEFSRLFIQFFDGRWEKTPVYGLVRDVFRMNEADPEAVGKFMMDASPYLAIFGDFAQEKTQLRNLTVALLDSGLLTREGVLMGVIAFNSEIESENLGWKLFRTRGAITPERRSELMKFVLSDSAFIRESMNAFAAIAQSSESRQIFVDALRSSELRRFKRSIGEIFPKSTWVGGSDPASEELGLLLRLWIVDSLRVLGPDLMRFHVQDSKSFNEFLSALARFSQSQSFEEIEELYSRHLPR